MPLSVFRGRPLAERTRHVYDVDGRLVESVTVREAAWLPSDRALALALEAHERSLCPGCGQPKHRAWHPGMRNQYVWREEDCMACGARSRSPANSPSTYLVLEDVRPRDKPLGPKPDWSESF